MSLGKMKYIPVDEEKLDDIEPKLTKLKDSAKEELDFMMYRE